MALSISSLQQQQGLDTSLPSLDTLVGHLLAAKRSLACVEHVSRANSLVTSTRTALEIHTADNARVEFLQSGCHAQTKVLHKIQSRTHDLVSESRTEHATVIQRLELADERLNQTLDSLRNIIVERALRPGEEESMCLLDFVDDEGVYHLRNTIEDTLASFKGTKQDYEDMGNSLDKDIARAEQLLSGHDQAMAASEGTFVIPHLLAKMEGHAQEMASNLESLVKHFDLCITAIKHTEGGGAAASKITNDLPEGVRMQLEQSDALEPIEPEERREMLDVLEKDSGEVDDVVTEIKERLSEMEADYRRVDELAESRSEQSQQILTALTLLEEVGLKLPKYTTQGQLFMIRWDEEKAKITDHNAELDDLREFFAGFIDAYNKLIIEVGRRKDTEKRVEKVRRDAVAKIERLLSEEVAERNHFHQAQGDFLPVNIWPGLMTSPSRYEFTVMEGTEDSLPDISASTITKAIRSLESGQRSLSIN